MVEFGIIIKFWLTENICPECYVLFYLKSYKSNSRNSFKPEINLKKWYLWFTSHRIQFKTVSYFCADSFKS